MELPIQLKFFKKLELYQELKFQDEKSRMASENLQKVWKAEKLILEWTVWHHHLLSHSIDYEYCKKGIIPKGKESEYSLSGAFTNLVRKEYAEYNKNKSGILFTKEGLLMGEVIYDVGKKSFTSYKYGGFYILVWSTAFFGALLVIFNFFEKIRIFDLMKNIYNCLCN